MSYRRITVTASTIGQANPSQVTKSEPYHWRKHPDWYPGNPDYREEGPGARKMRPGSGGDVNATRREKRLDDFAAALAALGFPDPWNATNRAVIDAGKRVGVGDRTAKSYHFELKQRTLRDGEVCDA